MEGLLGDPLAESDERAELRRSVAGTVARTSSPARIQELDRAERFDEELFAQLAAADVLLLDAPARVGGVGDVRDQLVVVEELASGPTSMAAFMIAAYAGIQALGRYGRVPVHDEVLESLVSGRAKVSFALSEPDGGTDVARVMQTRARELPGGGFEISGRKMWTSGATLADWLVVFARTAPPGRSAAKGITMFLVDARAPGIEVSEIDTFGIHGMSTCEVHLDAVEVGPDAVLGEVGAGMRQAFASVNREGIQSAAACIGIGRAALSLARQHAVDRIVFEKPIGSFQVPQHWLVDGAVALESARSLMVRAAEVEVAGGPSSDLASMAKLVASEAAVDVTLKGMQILGGLGYTMEVPMQRYFRDARLWSFSPLTNEMVRNRLGQSLLGLPRSY